MSTSTKRCYYETLEVERDADEGKLKSSFRKLAMKFHPDRNPGDDTSEVKFKEINEAYEVLKDKDKRAAYDRFGHGAGKALARRHFEARARHRRADHLPPQCGFDRGVEAGSGELIGRANRRVGKA